MRRDIARDKKWSTAAFPKLVWPALREQIGASEIIQGEGAKDHLRELADLMSGIDWWAVKRQGGMVAIASRVQQGHYNFSSFTIRFSRRTGNPTEFTKRLEELSNDELLGPTLMSHAYVDLERNVLLRGAVARTRDVMEAAQRFGRMREASEGGERFLYVDWSTMSEAGYPVTVYGPNESEIRKRLKAGAPTCVLCAQPCLCGQRDGRGKPCHYGCQGQLPAEQRHKRLPEHFTMF